MLYNTSFNTLFAFKKTSINIIQYTYLKKLNIYSRLILCWFCSNMWSLYSINYVIILFFPVKLMMFIFVFFVKKFDFLHKKFNFIKPLNGQKNAINLKYMNL